MTPKARRKRVLRACAACAGAAVALAVAFIAWPLPSSLLARRPVTSLSILDRSGDALREVRASDEARSVPLEDDLVPPLVRAAFIAAEDRRFDSRALPVDLRAIARAARDSLRAGRIVSGASTIPQQLARRLVPRERSVMGKAQEVLWALRLSAHVDKERVLLEYLNRVPLGNGVVGVEAASRFYFGRPARLLSPAQAALLAGLAHAPAREDPLRHPERALRRRAVILARMAEQEPRPAARAEEPRPAARAEEPRRAARDEEPGRAARGEEPRRAARATPTFGVQDAGGAVDSVHALHGLDDATLARALAEPLDVSAVRVASRAPHFTQAVVRSLEERGLGDAVTVETTIDAGLQRAVETIIDEELQGPLAEAHVGQAAAIVIDNATGEILAYAGSRDFFDEKRQGMNDGVRSKRQPGSALKPFVYGLALSRGFTPATLLPDVELTLATESGTYAPRNYDKRVHGPVRLRAALQNSYNIPAVHVAEELGPARILDELHAAGFDSLTEGPEHYGVGIVLGDGDITLYEMARAYSGLARGGVVHPLVDVREARDGAGHALSVASTFAPRRFLPKDAVALLTDILVDEQARAPAFGLDNALSLPFPVAAKTGTSRAYVDNWTAGFTHERTVAVWAGNFDGAPMRHVSGITGAGVIFRRVMVAAMNGIDPAPLVDDSAFDTVTICPLSGKRAGPSCAGAIEEHFLRGTGPTTSCTTHHLVSSSSTSARDCTHAVRALELEPRYNAWARGEGLTQVDGAALCDASPSPSSQAARLLSPVNGDLLVRELGVPEGQGIPIKVRAPGLDTVEVHTDDGAVLTLHAPFSTWIDAVPGVRTVALYVPGRSEPVDTATYTVR